MPAFRAVRIHERLGADRFADRALVDQVDAGLDPGPEKRVRRRPEPEILRGGELDQFAALVAGQRQRFLAEDMFAGFEGLLGDRVMSRRRAQVNHQVDRGIGKDLGQGFHGHARVRRRARLGPGMVEVGTGRDVDVPEQAGEVLEIDTGNVSATDDRNVFHGW